MRRPKTLALPASRDRIRDSAKSLFAERGFDKTTTAAICRLAGTSQSQLIKHFVDKQGVLNAIFEEAWEQINPAVQLATESMASPRDKLRMLIEMVLGFLEKDRALRSLFLLEGRRIRGDGQMVVLVSGFLEFVKTVDEILEELAAKNELAGDVNPQAFRSGLMGMIEGMLRDQLLSRTSKFPAAYNEADIRGVVAKFLSVCMDQVRAPDAPRT
jgi:TetR/AcrR family transcriptional regulator, transcriptional repressor of aconitase